MIQVISYEVKKKILIVGFKVDSFVVYSSIGYDTTKTKPQLLQLAYEQIKQTIDYEKTLNEHSIISDKVGEAFIPTNPIIKSVELILDKDYIEFKEDEEQYIVNLSTIRLDQYNDEIEGIPIYETSHGNIIDNVLEIPSVVEYTEVVVSSSIGSISDSKLIYVSPYVIPQPSKIDLLENEIAELKQTIDIMLGGEIIE